MAATNTIKATVINLQQSIPESGGSRWLMASEKGIAAALASRRNNLVAGAAEGILGPSAATGLAQVLTAPSDGVSIVDGIKGRTLKWNQRMGNGNFVNANGWVTAGFYGGNYSTQDNILTITPTDPVRCDLSRYIYTMKAGDKHLLELSVRTTAGTATISGRFTGDTNQNLTFSETYIGTTWKRITALVTSAYANNRVMFFFTDITDTGSIQVADVVLYNLTNTFTAGNEPVTAAAFDALYNLKYYAQNAGTFLPFKGTGLKVVGFNQWDEQWELGGYNTTTGQKDSSTDKIRSKNYIPVIGNAYYYNGAPVSHYFLFYDASRTFIVAYSIASGQLVQAPQKAAYITFYLPSGYGTTYNHNICINISNAALNGTYKPYTETVLNIDAIGKSAKDGDGNPIVPFPTGVNGDGTTSDEYGKDGGTLRWGVRAYEAGDESDATVITDGTNTVYPLDADVPFTWDEPFTLAFTAEEVGTIWLQPEGVDEAGVPVSAPLNADIAYTVPAGQVINATTLDNLLDALKTAGVISAYTMTPDGNGNYTFTITA